METFIYKGISDGKYVEGDIEALNLDEASHKLKEQKVIITNLVRGKKKKTEKSGEKKKGFSLAFLGKSKKLKLKKYNIYQTICNNGKSWTTNSSGFSNVKRSARRSSN